MMDIHEFISTHVMHRYGWWGQGNVTPQGCLGKSSTKWPPIILEHTMHNSPHHKKKNSLKPSLTDRGPSP